MSELLKRLDGRAPKIAIILGSSLGSFADAVEDRCRAFPMAISTGFPVPKISGHAGELVVGKVGGKEIAVLAGRAHAYESGNPAVMRPVIEALKDGRHRNPDPHQCRRLARPKNASRLDHAASPTISIIPA